MMDRDTLQSRAPQTEQIYSLSSNKRIKNSNSTLGPRAKSSSPPNHRTPLTAVKKDSEPKRASHGGVSSWPPSQYSTQSPSAPNTCSKSAWDSTKEASKQTEIRLINQDQLVTEVKGIYAGLVMVESKCIEVDNAQSSQNNTISYEQWQALIALHRTLLHEHHDFFLAIQCPSASQDLNRLATKYAMPARMWRQGIHSFLELLRHRLPSSLEHMLTFIYLAYSMMALLYETVPASEDTWIECLGDLGRYRMAIEDDDNRDREIWTSVSSHWYSKASDKSPTIGRLYHHLAMLARPNSPTNTETHDPKWWEEDKSMTRAKANAILRYLGASSAGKMHPGPQMKSEIEWRIHGSVRGMAVDALADTGANSNALSKSLATKLGAKLEAGSTSREIRLPNGKVCSSIGTTILRFKFAGENKIHKVRCNVVENLHHGIIFGYDFLQKTQTLTKYFKERVKSIACAKQQRISLCLLDDGHAATHCRARMVGLMEGQRAIVVPDTGSGIMAVSSFYAERLGLEVDATQRTEVMFADGSTAVTSGIAKATWQFLDPHPDTWEYEWHVIENLPVDAILDVHFVMEHDVFLKHQAAFVHNSQDLPELELAEIFGIVALLPQGSLELAVLADEFLSDLSSPNPFDYGMVDKEAARRTEILDSITKLPRDDQIQQRLNEQARIELWDKLKHLKETSENWAVYRDRYVSEIRQLQPAQQTQQARSPMHIAEQEGSSNTNGTIRMLEQGRNSIRRLLRRVRTTVERST